MHTIIFIGLLGFSFFYCSFAHRDSAYYHDEDDGFNFGRNRWMQKFCDSALLSELAMPGTHDSGTYKDVGGDAVTTQCLNFTQQLSVGIRVFDIRIRHINNAFTLHHGTVYLKVPFGTFLSEITQFLSRNPSETVLFRLKKEHKDGHGNTRSMEQTLEVYLNACRAWYLKTTSTSVTLGEARGKFIILNDCDDFNQVGINYDSLSIQDEYSLDSNWDLYEKWEDVRSHLTLSMNGDKQTWFMNYLSGSGGSFPYFVASGHSNPATGAARLATGRTTPGWKNSWRDFPRVSCFIGICTIAFEGTNILARDKIEEMNENYSISRSVGIIMADFPGDSLIGEIIRNNYRVCLNKKLY